MITFLIVILAAAFLEDVNDDYKKRNPKRRKHYGYKEDNSWLDAAWFHDHHQKL